MSNKKMMGIIIGILAVLAIGVLLTMLSILGSNQAKPLEDLLTNENCSTACWQGIEPAITERAFVTNMLAEANNSFETGSADTEGDAYTWELDADSPLILDDDEQSHVSVIFNDVGLVSQVWIAGIGVCPVTIVDTFGSPSHVNQNDHFVELFYFENGLAFFINTANSIHVAHIRFLTPEFAEEFSQLGIEVAWEDVADVLLGDCQDNFTGE